MGKYLSIGTNEEAIPIEHLDLENSFRKLPEREFCEIDKTEFDAPDGGYGWVVVASSFFCVMVVAGTLNCFGVYLSQLVKEFEETEGRIAWIASIQAGSTMLAGPFASALANKFGCRTACTIGSILASTSVVAAIFCPTLTWLMVVYVFAGTGLGLIILPPIVTTGYYFKSKRPLAIGLTMTGSGVGTSLFPPLINFIVTSRSWRAGNLTIAAIVLSTSLAAILMKPLKKKTIKNRCYNECPLMSHLPDLRKKEECNSTNDVSFSNKAQSNILYKQKTQSLNLENTTDSKNKIDSNGVKYFSTGQVESGKLLKRDIFYLSSTMPLNFLQEDNMKQHEKEISTPLFNFRIFKKWKFMLFIVLNIFPMLSYYIPFLFTIEIAKTNGIESAHGSFLLSVVGIVYAISQLTYGFIVNLPKVDPLFVFNLCLLSGSLAVTSVAFCVSYTSYTFAMIFFGMAIAGYISLGPIIVAELLGLDLMTNGVGLVLFCRGVAVFLGCPIAEALFDMSHSFQVVFIVGGGFFMIATILGFILQFVRRKQKNIHI